ncbi:MAG: Gfo/Idh/MocA family oxidoreductase [Candidatus Omnitrophica bacterium]|nr:Gfo/Idh/MocA family oxidoreductase [Candidatus Omnitrophota bacterium]
MKILQVGTGNFRKTWIEIIKKSPEWELVGIVDINRQTLQSVAQEYNIPEEKCFTSIEESIKNTCPSAVHLIYGIRIYRIGREWNTCFYPSFLNKGVIDGI